MRSDDPIQAYMQMPILDRWAINQLLPSTVRRHLRTMIKAHRLQQYKTRVRATDPAAALTCSQPLARHLVALAAEASNTAATAKTRQAVHDVIERFSSMA